MTDAMNRYYLRWACGHRRTGTNMTSRGTCRTCCLKALAKAREVQAAIRRPLSTPAASIALVRKYTTDRTKWRTCDHPRTPENTADADGKPSCRTCKLEAAKRWRERQRAMEDRERRALLADRGPRPQVLGDRSYTLAERVS